MMTPRQLTSAVARWWRRLRRGAYELPVVGPLLAIAVGTVRGFGRDDGLVMAAAISFYAILSLIPFLLLLLSVAGFLFEYLGRDAAAQKQLFTQIEQYVRAVVPFLGEDLLQRLREIVSRRGTYGVTGLVFMMLTAGLVFRSLELAFARIMGTARRRSLMKSQLLFIVFLMTLGLILLAVHYLGVLSSSFYSGRDAGFAQDLDDFLGRHLWLRLLLTLTTASGVFVVLLRYFTQERISWRYGFVAGVVFASLWMLAVHIFGLYLKHVARFSLIYGSLATLAIMVVWIFYSACILLLCAELASVLRDRAGASPVVPTDSQGKDQPAR